MDNKMTTISVGVAAVVAAGLYFLVPPAKPHPPTTPVAQQYTPVNAVPDEPVLPPSTPVTQPPSPPVDTPPPTVIPEDQQQSGPAPVAVFEPPSKPEKDRPVHKKAKAAKKPTPKKKPKGPLECLFGSLFGGK